MPKSSSDECPTDPVLIAVTRFIGNMSRASNMQMLALRMGSEQWPTKDLNELLDQMFDLVRASVVFAHASLEDLLRCLAGLRMATNPKSLDGVPFIIDEVDKRSEKVSLALLAGLKERSIDEIVERSVTRYLERRTFNSAAEIVGFFSTMGFDFTPLANHLEDVDRLIKRRHRIVHQVDYSDGASVKAPRMTNDEPVQILRWIVVTSNFGHLLARQVAADDTQQLIDRALQQFPAEKRISEFLANFGWTKG